MIKIRPADIKPSCPANMAALLADAVKNPLH